MVALERYNGTVGLHILFTAILSAVSLLWISDV